MIWKAGSRPAPWLGAVATLTIVGMGTVVCIDAGERPLRPPDDAATMEGPQVVDGVSEVPRDTMPSEPVDMAGGEMLAERQFGPTDIAVDDHFLYWSNYEGGQIRRLPKPLVPGSPPDLLRQSSILLRHNLFAGYGLFAYCDDGRLHLTSVPGGEIVTLDVAPRIVNQVYLTPSQIFWSELQVGVSRTVRSATHKLKDIRDESEPQPYGPSRFLIDGTYFYWCQNDLDLDLSTINRRPLSEGAAELFANTRFCWDLAADDENVYWLGGRQKGGVFRKPKSGGSPGDVTTLTDDHLRPQSMAFDQTNLYFTALGFASGLGLIVKVPKTGGPAIILAPNQVTPQGIAVDGTHVYWVNLDGVRGGTVRRIPK